MSSIKQQLTNATERLKNSSESARLDGEVLLAFVLQKPRSHLFTWPDKSLSIAAQQQFKSLLQQRLKGHPIAHLTGEREFWSLPLKVTPHTLIPRPDSELLVEIALENLPAQARVLELGTGTGALSLALASERPDLQILATDLSKTALKVAMKNAHQLAFSNITFLISDWFTNIPLQHFELILSNPPYIDPDDPHLNQGDLRFEPKSALVSAAQGLEDLGIIIQQATPFLAQDGRLLLEHGHQQGKQVRNLLEKSYFQNLQTRSDLAANERVTLAFKPCHSDENTLPS
ncbi:MAG: peptide chain release factor N(5)-glutamine methyltransferase [Gammaproteobacteria bacterium]|nr:peptide chain release factor N(5)-glutamine methyltransferase [Gammaproteobacteria bacterium]